MLTAAQHALDTARSARVKYADARVVLQRTQHLEAKNGELAEFEEAESLGIGVRVLRGRGWGFAATNDLSRGGIDRCVDQSLALAKASDSVARQPVRLAEQEPSRARWQTPVTEDPFAVTTSEKIDLLVRCSEALRIDPRITIARAEHQCAREEKVFASTEGAEIEQTLTWVSFQMQARATEGGEMQQRTWPAGLEGLAEGRGYEAIREIDPVAEAPRIAGEALALLSAPVCPPGRRDLIIGGDQLALQIHESIGHPSELDRALGHELNFAGFTYRPVGSLSGFPCGSPLVNITADAVTPGSVATFGFDDEGVPSQTWDIIREGSHIGWLDSRETVSLERAALLGEAKRRGTRLRLTPPRSHGCMRASGWNRVPIVRMVNVSLQPGDSSLEEIIADTRDGVLMETNRSWSIDHLRLNFQFGTEIGWEVKGGRRGRMLRGCTYQGRTPEFWGSCDRIAGPDEWRMWGVLNCGKGQPGQIMTTGHGCAPARFRDVNIGVT